MERTRDDLVRAAIRVSIASVLWDVATGFGSIAIGATAHALALVAFGLDSVVDASMSMVLIWRFRVERHAPARSAHVERLAARMIGTALLATALYVAIQAALDLLARSGPLPTTAGLAVAGASVAVLPFLAHAKIRLARRLDSAALRGDGVLTAAAVALAAGTLLGLGLAAALGLWWADSAVALAIAGALAVESRRLLSKRLSARRPGGGDGGFDTERSIGT